MMKRVITFNHFSRRTIFIKTLAYLSHRYSLLTFKVHGTFWTTHIYLPFTLIHIETFNIYSYLFLCLSTNSKLLDDLSALEYYTIKVPKCFCSNESIKT